MGTKSPKSLCNDNTPDNALPLAFFLSFNIKLKILGQHLGHLKIYKSGQAVYAHGSIIIKKKIYCFLKCLSNLEDRT